MRKRLRNAAMTDDAKTLAGGLAPLTVFAARRGYAGHGRQSGCERRKRSVGQPVDKRDGSAGRILVFAAVPTGMRGTAP